MAAWLKTFREGNVLSPRKSPTDLPEIGGRFIFFEPLSFNSDGSPKLTRHGEPMGKPSYEVGDLIGGYWNGSYEISEVWEVIGEPDASELDGWAWETSVELRALRKPGVPLGDLTIRPKTLARRVRLRLRPDQEALLESAFEL
jgi:hypothetical protein